MWCNMKTKQAEFGEAVSLIISTLLIVSLFIYLITCMVVRDDNPYVHITADHGPVSELPDGRYVIPVAIKNEGEKTVAFVKVSVVLADDEKQEIEIEYLPRGSIRQVYLYVDHACPENSIRFLPIYYRLD